MYLIARSALTLFALAPAAAAQFGPPSQVNEIGILGGSPDPADIDGDGHVDVVYGDSEGRIVWTAGQGGGQQGAAQLVDIFDYVLDVELADLDGDGDLDLVTLASFGGFTELLFRYEFLGAAGFGPRILVDPSLDGSRIELDDMDSDGDIDILANDNDTNEVFYVANLGGGQFATMRTVIVSGEMNLLSLEADDLDGDGDIDIVGGVPPNTPVGFVVHENTGSTNFTRHVVLNVVNGGTAEFALGDLDGDGDLDALATTRTDRFDWYEQTAPMTFVNRFQFVQPSDGSSCDMGDFDGDGDLDLVTYSTALEWHENDGSVTFVTHPLGPSPGFFGRVRAVDLDGSGTVDILFTSSSAEEAAWMSNAGGGVFGASQALEVDELPEPGAIAAADFDLDGDIDVAALSQRTMEVGFWDRLDPGAGGEPRFAPFRQMFSTNAAFTEMRRGECVAQDINMDGFPEIFVGGRFGALWFENLGTSPPTFGPAQGLSTPPRVTGIEVADVDGDGWFDVLFANDNQGQVWSYRGNGSGSFQSSVTIAIDFFSGLASDVTAGDFDGDGDLDVAISDSVLGGIRVAETLPNFDFAPPVTVLNGLTDAHSIATVDIDQDGNLDLVACGSTRARWLPGLGDGTFAASEPITGLAIQGNRVKMDVGDIDGDGRIDVIISAGGDGSAAPNVAWARNLGQGSWEAGGSLLEATTEIEDVVLADMDGDLDLDLVTVAPLDERVSLHLNESGVGTSFCSPAVVNSGGGSAAILGMGSNRLADDDLTLRAFDLPPNSAGYFLASRTQGAIQPSGSQGTLCLSGSIGRYVQQVGNSGASGTFDVSIQPSTIQQPTGPVSAVVGETWSFQCWFRDQVGGTNTSNFTSGYAVLFR